MKLEWKASAISDRERIMDYIAQDNSQAALDLDMLFEKKARVLIDRPNLFRTGRVEGTREAVAHPNYVFVYTVSDKIVTVLRVLHASQAWPDDLNK